ncbi:hypothetical protein ABEW32_20540 [Paenibacillus jamilae]|uniref:hypothetical protein n=1 Tax=Paenibacillus jamilae TaxID=114136 RepID=UPI003D28AFFF
MSQNTTFTLLNIFESKHLSKKLGALKYTLEKSISNRSLAKRLVSLAKDNDVGHIIMASVRKNAIVSNFCSRLLCFNIINHILNKIPNIVVTLINSSTCNPFEKGLHEKGVQGYLLKIDALRPKYIFSYAPSNERQYGGIFFKEKYSDQLNGIFASVRYGRLTYLDVIDGEVTRIIKPKRSN